MAVAISFRNDAATTWLASNRLFAAFVSEAAKSQPENVVIRQELADAELVQGIAFDEVLSRSPEIARQLATTLADVAEGIANGTRRLPEVAVPHSANETVMRLKFARLAEALQYWLQTVKP